MKTMRKLKNRKIFCRLLIPVMLIAILSACSSGEPQTSEPPVGDNAPPIVQTQFINIATGGSAGTYYPLGGAIAEILNNYLENINATASSTGGSVANIQQLNIGEADIGMIQNDIAYYAVTGTELFVDKPITGLKALASLYPESCQIITTADTGITSIADFSGKRIAVGAQNSGTEANARQIMAAAGITDNNVTLQYLSFIDAANGLKDGTTDAAFITAGFPTTAIIDVAALQELKLISLDQATCEALVKEYPFYTSITIPAGTYNGQNDDVTTVAVECMLVVTDKMPEELAYNITSAIFSNLILLAEAHPAGQQINLGNAQDGMSIPLHPGAQKFFDEQLAP